jgi:hypothetical protein
VPANRPLANRIASRAAPYGPFLLSICPSCPFPYAPSGLAPCPAHTQRTLAEERDRQDRRAKARCRKQRSYDATGDFVPNNSDNDLDDDDVDIYPAGIVFHAPDSVTGRALLACIEQPPAPPPTRELATRITHPLPPRPLIERIAPAPGPHAPTPSQSVLRRGAVPRISSLKRADRVIVIQTRLDTVFRRLNPLFKRHGLFTQQPLDVQDRVHKLGNQLEWCYENVVVLADGSRAQYEAVLHRCATIGRISFENYARNLPRIACNIADLSEQGYFGVFLNTRRG